MEKWNYSRKIKSNLKLNCFAIRLLFLFLLTFTLFTNGFSQAREDSDNPFTKKPKTQNRGFDSDKLRFGGSFGAAFGEITFVEISPTVGYLVKDYWLAGIGGRYMFYEDKHPLFYYRTNIYGGNVFNQFYLMEKFIIHSEVEVLNLDDRRDINKRANVTSIFIGGGYRSMISDRAFGSILILYNINDSYNTPYTNPVLRVSFGFGI